MKRKIIKPMTCRSCGGLVEKLAEDAQGQFSLIPLHNRGECVSCKRTHIIHRRSSGEVITVTMM